MLLLLPTTLHKFLSDNTDISKIMPERFNYCGGTRTMFDDRAEDAEIIVLMCTYSCVYLTNRLDERLRLTSNSNNCQQRRPEFCFVFVNFERQELENTTQTQLIIPSLLCLSSMYMVDYVYMHFFPRDTMLTLALL